MKKVGLLKEPMEHFTKTCREHNLKITPQRAAIYDVIAKSKDHPSADVVYRRVRETFSNISFDTVNRTLLTFSKIGIVNVVEGYGESKRFDPDVGKHHHFRCLRCNDIKDFQERSFDEIRVPEGMRDTFTVRNVRVIIEGICGECDT
jgi:Fur family peroxide stress response transcriptional regulator